MSETLRIFLGADEWGADNEELRRLGKEARSDGFVLARQYISAGEIMAKQKPKKVEIRGGYTDICVAVTVEEALKCWAEVVKVDLRYCRTDDTDYGESVAQIMRRRYALYFGIRPNYRDNPRIYVLPEKRRLRNYFRE